MLALADAVERVAQPSSRRCAVDDPAGADMGCDGRFEVGDGSLAPAGVECHPPGQVGEPGLFRLVRAQLGGPQVGGLGGLGGADGLGPFCGLGVSVPGPHPELT